MQAVNHKWNEKHLMTRKTTSRALVGASIITIGIIGYSLITAYKKTNRSENHPRLSYSQALEVQRLMANDASGMDVWGMAFQLFCGDLADNADKTVKALKDDYKATVPSKESAFEWALKNRRWITEEFVVAVTAGKKSE